MDFSTLSKKLENFEYEYNYELFERDLDLIWTNCIFYNKSETDYSKAAYRYRKRSLNHIVSLRSEVLKRKLITSTQWSALLRARCFDLERSRDKNIAISQEIIHSAFAGQSHTLQSNIPTNSLGHNLLSLINSNVFDILWNENKDVSINDKKLASISIFNTEKTTADLKQL